MSLTYFSCEHCHAATFPKRFRCARCGTARFVERALSHAQVMGVTEAHRRPDGWPYPFLVDLHAEHEGLPLLAVSRFAPSIGQRVQVFLSDTGLAYIES
jgi:uncharacterized OB-fold protein